LSLKISTCQFEFKDFHLPNKIQPIVVIFV
jgi:hypothetical protein